MGKLLLGKLLLGKLVTGEIVVNWGNWLLGKLLLGKLSRGSCDWKSCAGEITPFNFIEDIVHSKVFRFCWLTLRILKSQKEFPNPTPFTY